MATKDKQDEKTSTPDIEKLMKELEDSKAEAITLQEQLAAGQEELKSANSNKSMEQQELEKALADFENQKKDFADEQETFKENMARLSIDVSNPPVIKGVKVWLRCTASRAQIQGVVFTKKGPKVRAVNIREGWEGEAILPEGCRQPRWAEYLDDEDIEIVKKRQHLEHKKNAKEYHIRG